MLRSAMRERGISLKEALNEAVRSGLTAARPKAGRRFVQKTFALGVEQHFRWDKALAAADAIEDEETARKLSLRK